MKHPKKPVRRLCAAGLLAVLAAVGWYENYTVRVLTQTIASARLPEGFDGFRIAQIADLHAREFGKDNAQLVELVRAQKPDLIALTGDLADERRDPAALRPFLRALCAIAPVYFVTGNHEWVLPKKTRQAMFRMLEDVGVQRLRNDFVTLTRGGDAIILAGVDDPNGPADQKTPAQLFSEIWEEADDAFVLLLAHRNDELARWAHLGADVVLCGHAHGGVVRLPGVGGLLGTHYELFPDYDAGLYEGGRTAMYVSPGFGGVRGLPLRVLNRPALCVLELRREPAANP